MKKSRKPFSHLSEFNDPEFIKHQNDIFKANFGSFDSKSLNSQDKESLTIASCIISQTFNLASPPALNQEEHKFIEKAGKMMCQADKSTCFGVQMSVNIIKNGLVPIIK